MTDAAIHDSRELETLIDRHDTGQKLYADSAYIDKDENIDWCGITMKKPPKIILEPMNRTLPIALHHSPGRELNTSSAS
ncbi:MAG: hypothetical protein WBP54_09245 [Pelodictyon phaeoclathratiforme]